MIWQTIYSALLTFVILLQSSLGLPVYSLGFKIDNAAAVFETGDEMYTVMWTTTRPGSGYVTYTYDGKDYTVTDQENGCIRSLDTIHSVRVPKAHLNNNTYVYHSQYVATKQGYSAIKGKTVSSEPVRFKGYDNQDEINVLVLSDIHEYRTPAENAVKHFEKSADLVVLNGDITSTMVEKKQVSKIISYANFFSDGGEIPVAYIRGNHETRGEFASEMPKYFKTETSGLYYSFNYGPIYFLALDSGEDKEDDHREYSGLVDFNAYINKESVWLNSLTPVTDAEYNICLVHMPELEDRYGSNWLESLSRLQMDAVISGHWHSLDLNFREGTAPFYRIIDGGKVGYTDDYIATMFTFAGGKMQAQCFDTAGNLCGEQTYTF